MAARKLITNLKTAEERLAQRPAVAVVAEPAGGGTTAFPSNIVRVLKLAKGQTPAPTSDTKHSS